MFVKMTDSKIINLEFAEISINANHLRIDGLKGRQDKLFNTPEEAESAFELVQMSLAKGLNFIDLSSSEIIQKYLDQNQERERINICLNSNTINSTSDDITLSYYGTGSAKTGNTNNKGGKDAK